MMHFFTFVIFMILLRVMQEIRKENFRYCTSKFFQYVLALSVQYSFCSRGEIKKREKKKNYR